MHDGVRAQAANLDLRRNARTKFEKLIGPDAKPVPVPQKGLG
jgi:hypothetical protein